MHIKLFTDGTASLGKALLEKENIEYVESMLLIDGEYYNELSGIDRDEFIKTIESVDPYPVSSQASVHDVVAKIQKTIDEGYKEIFYIGISPNISSQYNIVRLACKKFKGKIKFTLYESGFMGSSEGALVSVALKLLKQGKTTEEIIPILDEIKTKIRTYIVSDSFDTLFKTGKIKKKVSLNLMTKLMRLKPISEINLDVGVVGIGGGIGTKHSLKKVLKMLNENLNKETEYDLILCEAGSNEHFPYIEQELNKLFKIKETLYWETSPVIIWAVGVNTIMMSLVPHIST
ncbi:MAG: DegV family protein [Candidatus Heimdallarchaeaceae archaeon]